MISRLDVEYDLHLKRLIFDDNEEVRPRFDWSEVAQQHSLFNGTPPAPRVRLTNEPEPRPIERSYIANMIGSALTDLLLSRQEVEIFTDENRHRVAAMAAAVHQELERRANQDPLGSPESLVLSEDELTAIIERALIRNNQHDIARSLIFRHRSARPTEAPDLSTPPGQSAVYTDRRLPKLMRRHGHTVPWNQNKIEIAIAKAFLSQQLDPAPAASVAQGVTDYFAESSQDIVHIEDVQDKVQEELMRRGHYKVAAHYVLYRSHRAEIRRREAEVAREQESIQQQSSFILVTEADGSTQFWDGADLRARIKFAMTDLDLCLTAEQIEVELRRSIFENISVRDLAQTVKMNAKMLLERDADFNRFAGRIMLTYIYEEVLGWDIIKHGPEKLGQFHRQKFREHITRGVEIKRLTPKLLDLELDKLAEAIDPLADLEFEQLGIQTLYDRYLIVDKTMQPHRRLETPQLFWMRVAMGLFLGEPSEQRTEHIIALYNLYKGRRFCSSTPTLFNSGTLHSQLSSCYLYKVDDSIESIMMRGIADNAFLSKWAGGLGGSWTAVRGTGSHIAGTNGESQGVIPFLKLHNDQLIAVNQGGKRRGSGCAYLETWHNDIMDFLQLRVNTGDDRRRTHDMNTAHWIPDLFMKRMELRQDWTLFRSNEVPDLHDTYGKKFEERYVAYEAAAARGEIFGKAVPAIDMWKDMLKMIFETGHPWLTFKDPCNLRSPQDHCGVIHSSNLCTEITLNTSEEETAVCNLGSIILENHLDPHGQLDHKKLRETIRIAVRALDNVIDINFYPTKAAETSNRRHRPIGLGIMGLSNALNKKGIAFASEAAVEFNDEFMEAIAYYAYEASSDLAAERGAYQSYQGSKWSRGLLPQDTIDLLEQERGEAIVCPRGGKMDWNPVREKIARQGMRNSNVLAIAPTATISNIMGSSPCIEPNYKNLFVKSNLGGEFIELNEFLVRDLKKLNLWSKDMVDKLKYHDGELGPIEEIPADVKLRYATAFGIEYHWLIQAAARRQKWIDQSQSLNLFLATPDQKTLSHMYRAAWRAGLKTTYYLRTLAANNIEKASVAVEKELRGVIANGPAEAAAEAATPKACSIEAMLRGEVCEACQ